MESITVPAGQQLKVESFAGNDGPVEYINYVCIHGGLMKTVRSYGGAPRMAQLTEAMQGQKPLEIEGIAPDKRNNLVVKFPKGSGGQAGYRSRFGGGSYTPAGYKGQPFPFDVWVNSTVDVLVQSVNALKMATKGVEGITPDAIMEQARSLTAQYWMAVEKNMTFPAGFEPKAQPAAAASEGNSGATTAAQASSPGTTVVAEGGTVALYEQSIASATDIKLLDGLKATLINDATLADDSKVQLQMAILNRKRALTPQG